MENHKIKYLISWDEAFHAGSRSAGGKGWNLARLARYGFTVPPGHVLTARAYEDFIEYNGLQARIDEINTWIADKNPAGDEACTRLDLFREQICNSDISFLQALAPESDPHGADFWEKPFAVRSSAIAEDSDQASFAGIHASYLHVTGLNNILGAVKECYASLWTPQAVAYRRKMKIPADRTAMAVVIMEMVEARAAGVGFSCDPNTGSNNVLVVNANFGLGESVVNGSVDPDTYYLDGNALKPFPTMTRKKLGKKQGITRPGEQGRTQFVPQKENAGRQVLTDEQIIELGLLIQQVFDALGQGWNHQDVEWAFDGHKFFIVQARPVTAHLRCPFPALQDQPDIWSNGNFRDAVPMVLSPICRRFMQDTIEQILIASFEDSGYRLPDGLPFSRFFNGRLYCNLSALQWVGFDAMGGLPKDTNIFWGGHQPEIKLNGRQPFKGMAGIKRMWRGMRSFMAVNAHRKKAPEIHARVKKAVADITSRDFSKLENRELIDLFESLGAITGDYARKFSLLAATGSMPVMLLIRKLAPYFPDRAFFAVNSLMVGGKASITSADHGYRLVELAGIAQKDPDAVCFFNASPFIPDTWRDSLPEDSSFRQAFLAFLDDYGHRALYELDLINPRWNEDQTYLLEIIQSNLGNCDLNPKTSAFSKKIYS